MPPNTDFVKLTTDIFQNKQINCHEKTVNFKLNLIF